MQFHAFYEKSFILCIIDIVFIESVESVTHLYYKPL